MDIIAKLRGFLAHLFCRPRKESEKEIHDRIMKKRAKAYEELARY